MEEVERFWAAHNKHATRQHYWITMPIPYYNSPNKFQACCNATYSPFYGDKWQTESNLPHCKNCERIVIGLIKQKLNRNKK